MQDFIEINLKEKKMKENFKAVGLVIVIDLIISRALEDVF